MKIVVAFAVAACSANYAVAQTTTVRQAYVVDSRNVVVGLLGPSTFIAGFVAGSVLMTFDGTNAVNVAFGLSGFLPTSQYPDYYYTTSNCTGVKYLLYSSLPITAQYVEGTNFLNYSIASDVSTQTFQSEYHLHSSVRGDVLNCEKMGGIIRSAAPVKTVSISSLHFTPPFNVVIK